LPRLCRLVLNELDGQSNSARPDFLPLRKGTGPAYIFGV